MNATQIARSKALGGAWAELMDFRHTYQLFIELDVMFRQMTDMERGWARDDFPDGSWQPLAYDDALPPCPPGEKRPDRIFCFCAATASIVTEPAREPTEKEWQAYVASLATITTAGEVPVGVRPDGSAILCRTVEVMANKDLRRLAFKQAIERLQRFKARYRGFVEFAIIIDDLHLAEVVPSEYLSEEADEALAPINAARSQALCGYVAEQGGGEHLTQ